MANNIRERIAEVLINWCCGVSKHKDLTAEDATDRILKLIAEAVEGKKRVVQIGDSDNGMYPTSGYVCIHGINLSLGKRLCIECANDRGYNQSNSDILEMLKGGK